MSTDLSAYSAGVHERVKQGQEVMRKRDESIKRMKQCRFDTVSVHGLYNMEEALELNQGSIIEPAYLSTSQAYRDSDEMEAGLAYLIPNWCYSRIANPTTFYLEWSLALLEGYGTDLEPSAVVTSSGMAAIMSAVEPFLVKLSNAPDEPINFVSSAHVYGGTFQQFNIRQPEKGRQVRWIPDPTDLSAWEAKIDENTRLLYAELPSNPTINFCDIEKLAKIAHRHGIPLIVDATVATPALMRPLAHGADIVIHSVSKSLTSSGMGVGGVLISRKNLVSEKVTEPREMVEDFATWVKFLPYRDNGPSMNPMQALLTLNDLRTLRSKMDLVSQSTQTVAEYLESHPKIERVDYLGLSSNPLHDLAKRYMFLVDSDLNGGELVNRYGHLMSFRVKGNAEDTRRVFDGFEMIFRATDLGRIKSVATIPSISTHQQLGEEARAMADVPGNLIRLNVGGEHPDDIIADLERGLAKI
jgi:O-acetylhomoserine/O-acetylserine sulfhydrylase-like pyridoxal-dependent enzyme